MSDSTTTQSPADSVAEPFGFRWATAVDKYLRTWLDFLFLRPRRFVRRYETRRRRYTRPAVFLIDTLIVTAVASWAFIVLHGDGDRAASVRNEIALETLWIFGQTVISIALATLALRLVGRKPRLRRMFTAAAYSSALVLLLPFFNATMEFAASSYPTAEGSSAAMRVFGIVFSAVHFVYLFAAIAATHHMRIGRVATGATLVVAPILFLALLVLPWDVLVNRVERPTLSLNSGKLNRWLTDNGYPLAVNRETRSPHAAGWFTQTGASDDVQFLHFRIPCKVEGGGVRDLKVNFASVASSNGTTVFRSEVSSASVFDVTGYVEVDWLNGKRLEWWHTAYFACDSEHVWPLPLNQIGHEIVTRGGLRLGDWPKPGCAIVVVTFKVVPV